MKKYAFLGNDERTKYLRKIYIEEGVNVTSLEDADYIITTIPLSRDNKTITGEELTCDRFLDMVKDKVIFTGALNSVMKEKMNGYKYYDLMSYDSVAILNAIPTAEGAIYEAIALGNGTLCNSKCLILGFGRIGKILARMLKGIGAEVYLEARKDTDLSYIEALGYKKVRLNDIEDILPNVDYIFNTIPYMILDSQKLSVISKNTCIIDLASSPGGVDFKEAENLGIKTKWALSLPSKVSPKAAALYLKEQIDKIIKNELGDRNVY